MFKLLTDEERQKVKHKYYAHRAVVMLSAFILVLMVGVIGLLPSYLLSNARKDEVLERTRIMNISEQYQGEEDLEAWLNKVNNSLQTLSPKLDTDRPSDFINKILEQKIPGVGLTTFSWKKSDGAITLSIRGVGKDRQTLLAFEKKLNDSGYFSEITLPISNLAKDKEIDFNINFSFAKQGRANTTP